MKGEGRFFGTLSSDQKTFVPGGIETNGPIKIVENDLIQEFFNVQPVCVEKDGTAASGTDGAENVMSTGSNVFEYHVISTGGATITAPVLVAGGLNVEGDGTDNTGFEYSVGILSSNRAAFTVGTDAAFYAKMQFYINDVSDFDDCAFGFRKAEAYQAAIDNYDEMACLNVISGDIKIETILNGGATTTTDTTNNWADDATHELEVRVSSAGVVTYKIDGMAPTTTAAFTFDDAEVVVPFFYFLHATGAATGLYLKSFECGLQ